MWLLSSQIKYGHCFKRQAISHGNCAALATLPPLSMYSRLPPLFLQCWWRPLPRQWQTLCRAQKNCMLAQAKGAIQSWASNLDNRFNRSIQRVRHLDAKHEHLAHELSWINANHVWGLNNTAQNLKLRQLQAQQIIKTQALHDPKSGSYQLPANVFSLRTISPQATRYARSLYLKYLQWAKPPSSANQPLMANINSITRAAPSRSKFKYFSHWVSLSSLERGSRIVLPLERNSYLDIGGVHCHSSGRPPARHKNEPAQAPPSTPPSHSLKTTKAFTSSSSLKTGPPLKSLRSKQRFSALTWG